jgi:hypothetical protein
VEEVQYVVSGFSRTVEEVQYVVSGFSRTVEEKWRAEIDTW